MSMGLFDIPGIVLDVINSGFTWLSLPIMVRILIWSALAAAAGMWLYRRYSPQVRIAGVRSQISIAQRELAKYDGEFDGLLPLIGRQFRLVFTQMRLTLGSAMLAGLPVLLLLPWLSNQYSHDFPESGTEIRICIEPESAAGLLYAGVELGVDINSGCRIMKWPSAEQPVALRDDLQLLATLPLPASVPIVHQRSWLNLLVGNPAGYLPDSSAIEALRLDLPQQQFVKLGPSWMRGWEFPYFAGVLLISLFLRSYWKLY